MGDFNDEPFDTSLVTHALSTRQRQRVTTARTVPRLWNLMWPATGRPDGTFYFGNQPHVLDQFLANKNMATANSPLRVEAATVEILRFPGMTNPGVYPKPRPFGGMGKPVDEGGFSDHFPVGLSVTEAD